MQSLNKTVIIAQSTPIGKGALALIRFSGNGLYDDVDAMVQLLQGRKLKDQASHTIHYGCIVDKNREIIDQVMFFVMRAPRTFTGDDVLEITCHNNQFIINNIIQEAINLGFRLAGPGEFTQRAFENKKLDLLQAEAINDLISAQTQSALKKSLAQLQGSLSAWIIDIEQRLVKVYAWSEASFEFLDDEGDFGVQIQQQVQEILDRIVEIKKSFDIQKQIREGFRIALIGSVNAGKSSLFNRLLGQDRAIVTPIAGTTRDTIEAGLYRNGNYWTLIDTAGLRTTDDLIEQTGIKRSWQEAGKADIILLVIDSSRVMIDEERSFYEALYEKYAHKIIILYSKSDLAVHNLVPVENSVLVSTITGHNCDYVEQKIQDKIITLLVASDAPFLLNQRHYTLLLTLEQQLEHIMNMLQGDIQYELVSYHIRQALEEVSQMTGKSVSEAALDMVFKEFCVGK